MELSINRIIQLKPETHRRSCVYESHQHPASLTLYAGSEGHCCFARVHYLSNRARELTADALFSFDERLGHRKHLMG